MGSRSSESQSPVAQETLKATQPLSPPYFLNVPFSPLPSSSSFLNLCCFPQPRRAASPQWFGSRPTQGHQAREWVEAEIQPHKAAPEEPHVCWGWAPLPPLSSHRRCLFAIHMPCARDGPANWDPGYQPGICTPSTLSAAPQIQSLHSSVAFQKALTWPCHSSA